jgi:hypothetical protein
MNVQLDTLRKKITNGHSTAYCYIIATVKSRAGTFVQTGSGPNFQGDWITLCTCKHYMRTFISLDAWKGKWIAGFTGSRVDRERNSLVYLMQVSHAFESHRDFWFSDVVPAETKRAKAANLDEFGDVYQPKRGVVDPFDSDSYVPPCNHHVHAPCAWHADVDYTGCSSRRAALLIGDPQYSFLWDHAMIHCSFKLHRGQKKLRIDNLLRQLRRRETL